MLQTDQPMDCCQPQASPLVLPDVVSSTSRPSGDFVSNASPTPLVSPPPIVDENDFTNEIEFGAVVFPCAGCASRKRSKVELLPDFEPYVPRYSILGHHTTENGYTPGTAHLLRHVIGPHNLTRMGKEKLGRLGLNNVDRVPDNDILPEGIKQCQLITVPALQALLASGQKMPHQSMYFASPSYRVIRTLENSIMTIPDFKGIIFHLSGDSRETNWVNQNDALMSRSELQAKLGPALFALMSFATDLSETDTMWRCLGCSLLAASQHANEEGWIPHERADAVRAFLGQCPTFRDQEWQEVPISPERYWREPMERMWSRCLKAMDDKMDHLYWLRKATGEEIPPDFFEGTHSRISSIFRHLVLNQDGGLQAFQDEVERTRTKLQNGEVRSVPFSFKLLPDRPVLPSKWPETIRKYSQEVYDEMVALGPGVEGVHRPTKMEEGRGGKVNYEQGVLAPWRGGRDGEDKCADATGVP